MPKLFSDQNVLDAAKGRIREQYLAGNRLVCSISGGKDSTVIMELCIQVARELNMLPVHVIMRDEEIMIPGTFEYLERVSQRPEVAMHWVIAGQAIINAYNRFNPYWWVFDPAESDKWVRQPPAWAERIPEQNIGGMTTLDGFPTTGKLLAVIGLRASESLMRLTRIASTGGAMTKHPSPYGAYNFAPIYDWQDDDVWKAIKDFGWDYNSAYNGLFQVGCPKSRLRIAPPSMRQDIECLQYYLRLWPGWFDAVEARLPGIRTAARFGKRALEPMLGYGETWQDCYMRLLDEATIEAPWMASRMQRAMEFALRRHRSHSSVELPMTAGRCCKQCKPPSPGSWQGLAASMYNGDPWSHYNQILPPLEPYDLRSGAKGWFEKGKGKGALHW